MSPTRTLAKTRKSRRDLKVWTLGDEARPEGPFVALVPGMDAPLMRVNLPDSLAGRARDEVARRQICDRLGQSPAQVSIRPATLGQTHWSRVLVASRDDLRGWTQALGDGAGACRALLPDYLGLPARQGLWVIEHLGTQVRARLGLGEGFSAEPDLAAEMLRLALLEPGAAPRAVLALGKDWPALRSALDTANLQPQIAHKAEEFAPELRPERFAHDELELDLARAPDTPSDGMQRALRRLLLPFGLAVLGAGAWVGAQIVETRTDQTIAAELRRETTAAARRDLLGQAPILDLRAQVQRAIEAAQSQTSQATRAADPLAIVHAATQALSQNGLNPEEETTPLRRFEFGGARTGVLVEFVLPDFQTLDALQEALAAQGLGVALERTGRNEAGQVAAVLSLAEEGAP